jgi:inosose dehydratase
VPAFAAPLVALNPLPWLLQGGQFAPLAAVDLPDILVQVRSAGFDAVMADRPAELTLTEYADRLTEAGVRPAPGYFAAAFHEEQALTAVLDQARRHAAEQARLGLTEVFVAAAMDEQRLRTPAVGAAARPGVLEALTVRLERVAKAMLAEGVRPCLHPHVGTLVEVEAEVRFVLDHTDPEVLAFGPDTGHLFWAGTDPAAIIADYADRVGGVHLKDVHEPVARVTREQGASYDEATVRRNLWTEPGRGDIDFAAVLASVPQDFAGWWVVEVDVPDAGTPLDSARVSAAWVRDCLTRTPHEGALA